MRGTWQGSGTWKTTGGSGGGLVLVAAVVLIGSGAGSAIAAAVVTILIAAACVLGAAVLGTAGVLIYRYRTRSDRPGAPVTARALSPLPPERRPQLEVPYNRAAIEAPRNELHLHFHGMTPDEAAEAIRRAGEGR